MGEGLSEQEKWELALQLMAAGKGPRPGRPRKDASTVTWADLGLNRMEVYRARQLARAEDILGRDDNGDILGGYGPSYRAILVRAGLVKNVSDENVFRNTELGALAEGLLRRAEGFLLDEHLSHRWRRWVVPALHARLRD